MTRPSADDLENAILDEALEDARMRRAEGAIDQSSPRQSWIGFGWHPGKNDGAAHLMDPTDKHNQVVRSWKDPAFLVAVALGLAVFGLVLVLGG